MSNPSELLALADQLDVHVVLCTCDGVTTIYGPFPTQTDAVEWTSIHARNNRTSLFHLGRVHHPDTKVVILNG